MKQYKALKTRVGENPYEVCCIRNCDRKPLFVTMVFKDNRTLARLMIPRVIECFAEALECSPTNLVVLPFAKGEAYVGNCESMASMWWLADQVHLPVSQLQMTSNVGDFVTSRPYRVTHAVRLFR